MTIQSHPHHKEGGELSVLDCACSKSAAVHSEPLLQVMAPPSGGLFIIPDWAGASTGYNANDGNQLWSLDLCLLLCLNSL